MRCDMTGKKMTIMQKTENQSLGEREIDLFIISDYCFRSSSSLLFDLPDFDWLPLQTDFKTKLQIHFKGEIRDKMTREEMKEGK